MAQLIGGWEGELCNQQSYLHQLCRDVQDYVLRPYLGRPYDPAIFADCQLTSSNCYMPVFDSQGVCYALKFSPVDRERGLAGAVCSIIRYLSPGKMYEELVPLPRGFPTLWMTADDHLIVRTGSTFSAYDRTGELCPDYPIAISEHYRQALEWPITGHPDPAGPPPETWSVEHNQPPSSPAAGKILAYTSVNGQLQSNDGSFAVDDVRQLVYRASAHWATVVAYRDDVVVRSYPLPAEARCGLTICFDPVAKICYCAINQIGRNLLALDLVTGVVTAVGVAQMNLFLRYIPDKQSGLYVATQGKVYRLGPAKD